MCRESTKCVDDHLRWDGMNTVNNNCIFIVLNLSCHMESQDRPANRRPCRDSPVALALARFAILGEGRVHFSVASMAVRQSAYRTRSLAVSGDIGCQNHRERTRIPNI